jgi:hypothetical protein
MNRNIPYLIFNTCVTRRRSNCICLWRYGKIDTIEFDEYGNKSIERYRYWIGIQNEENLVKMN